MSRHLLSLGGRSIVLALSLACLGACGSPDATGGQSSAPAGPSATAAPDPLEGIWSTGPVPIEDIRAVMLAAGLDADAVEGWIEDQRAPAEMTFELRFDPPDFTHSRADGPFRLEVDESGTFVFVDGELRLSFPDLGDACMFDATRSDDTLSLELVDQHGTGTIEDRETHRLYTIALYASAPFVRRS